ncbi:allantoate amidohydrolase (plasmid) [Photobacterium sp. DA100]|uniref:allantoate amidohydrolase n=1 Tax=Photobacterium sp. DA100 TaxID=3027472 RepID=UPI00247967D9|nr:allantoate amidohydrolase [Photobacterium sp. DA100]WEM44734.1 allantoate amidohydrolase [Photobacterium sp. DA100]
MTGLKESASLTWEWLEEIARCSQTADPDREGVTRLCASDEHRQANDKLRQWMLAAGMQVRMDNAANLIGRYPSAAPDAKTLIFGSHQDTVPNGGKYDGILGVIAPLALVHYFNQNQIAFPYHIDVIAFSDEEGTRFQSTLLGSKAISGTFEPAMLDAADAQGTTMRQALEQFGCRPELISHDAYQPEEVLGFVELHIEQGPQLEQADLPVGVVSAITGIERHTLSIKGKAGHAGTVPMNMRQDALVGAAQVIHYFDQLCKGQDDLVGVVGKIENFPNGVNVIPQQTDITIELRSPNDASRLAARSTLLAKIAQIMADYDLGYEHQLIYQQAAVTCSESLSSMLAQATSAAGIEPMQLFSGAGHDGLAVTHLTDIAMLFMRCKNGVSHHPDEAITQVDLLSALDVLQQFCLLLKGDSTRS